MAGSGPKILIVKDTVSCGFNRIAAGLFQFSEHDRPRMTSCVRMLKITSSVFLLYSTKEKGTKKGHIITY